MAIYSLNHRPIGKTTQSRPYTASAHVGYITRRGAKPQVAAARMPDKAADAQAFFRKVENTSRANARVGDKLMLALPRELSPEQRVALVRGYAEQITQGRAPWFAAFHDNGADAHNPHCHLLFHDRDQDTGRRVFGTSEAGSTERLRRLWQHHANAALEAAEHQERIDHRSLEAQGIKRPAPIHEGPKSQAARRRGVRPRSRPINARNGRGARSRFRQVDYPRIDRGRTRAEFNRAIAVGAESEQDYWQAVDADRQARELDALQAIHRPPDSVDEGRNVVRLDKVRGRGQADITIPLGQLAPDLSAPGRSLFGSRDAVQLPPGGGPLPTGLKPAADKEPFGQHQHQSADLLGEQIQPMDDMTQHDATLSDISGLGKENPMEIDVQKILANHLRDVEQAEYQDNIARSGLDSLMERAFLDPDAARKRMDAYGLKHGRTALYDKLGEKNVTRFGRRPGSILSGEGYKPDADQQRRDADVARQSLPGALRQADDSQARLDQARRAYRDARARYGLPAEGPGAGPLDGHYGRKNLAGKQPAREMAQSAETKDRPAPGLQQHGMQPPRPRPPRFGDVARGRPDEPVAYSHPQPGDKPAALGKSYKPQQVPPVGKTFAEKMQDKNPAQQSATGTFAEKLAAARDKPKPQQSKSRGRDDEIER